MCHCRAPQSLSLLRSLPRARLGWGQPRLWHVAPGLSRHPALLPGLACTLGCWWGKGRRQGPGRLRRLPGHCQDSRKATLALRLGWTCRLCGPLLDQLLRCPQPEVMSELVSGFRSRVGLGETGGCRGLPTWVSHCPRARACSSLAQCCLGQALRREGWRWDFRAILGVRHEGGPGSPGGSPSGSSPLPGAGSSLSRAKGKSGLLHLQQPQEAEPALRNLERGPRG